MEQVRVVWDATHEGITYMVGRSYDTGRWFIAWQSDGRLVIKDQTDDDENVYLAPPYNVDDGNNYMEWFNDMNGAFFELKYLFEALASAPLCPVDETGYSWFYDAATSLDRVWWWYKNPGD